jgi:hypothetical protein
VDADPERWVVTQAMSEEGEDGTLGREWETTKDWILCSVIPERLLRDQGEQTRNVSSQPVG